jgi:hypothetical protein
MKTDPRTLTKAICLKVRTPNINKTLVEDFLCRDDNSRMSAGKKEARTYRGSRKQVRYLLSTMECLYHKFTFEFGQLMSRSSFYKLRPFYVLKPKLNDRNQCLCIQCTNLQVRNVYATCFSFVIICIHY